MQKHASEMFEGFNPWYDDQSFFSLPRTGMGKRAYWACSTDAPAREEDWDVVVADNAKDAAERWAYGEWEARGEDDMATYTPVTVIDTVDGSIVVLTVRMNFGDPQFEVVEYAELVEVAA